MLAIFCKMNFIRSISFIRNLLCFCLFFHAISGNAQQNVGYLDSWMTPGSPGAILKHGNTVYMGGVITEVGYPEQHGALLDAATAIPTFSFLNPNGVVHAAVPDGAGGWFIGGHFTKVGGQKRMNLARINLDGSLHPWDPGANDKVYCLAISGSTLYVGGEFYYIRGVSRDYLAAIDVNTGFPTTWKPSVNNAVRTIAVSSNRVYAGGDFVTANGQTRNHLAAFNKTNGGTTSWNPNVNQSIYTMDIVGSTLYIGGIFSQIGSVSRSGLAAVDVNTALATSWQPFCGGYAFSIKASANKVYVGGEFSAFGTGPIYYRSNLAAIDAVTGIPTSWDPGSIGGKVRAITLSGGSIYIGGDFTYASGNTRNYLAAYDTLTASLTAWNPSANSLVHAMASQGGKVYAGGDFTLTNKVKRKGIAAFDAATGIVTPWNPDINGIVRTIAAKDGKIYIGGQFTLVGNQVHNGIAAIDSVSGAPISWNPSITSTNPYPNPIVYSVLLDGGTVYAGGSFTHANGQIRNNIAAIDEATGILKPWNPDANGHIATLAVNGSAVYAGGGFTSIGGQARMYISALDTGTGLATSWNPIFNSTVYNPVSAILPLPDLVYASAYFGVKLAAIDYSGNIIPSWYPQPNEGPNTIAVHNNVLYTGGLFVDIDNKPRKWIAGVDLTTGHVNNWHPNLSYYVNTLAINDGLILCSGSFSEVEGDESRAGFVVMIDSTNLVPNQFDVTISASDTSLCPNSAVSFYAAPSNAGNAPSYQWRKNGNLIGGATDINYTENSPATGDFFDVIVTSSNVGSAIDTSNAITVSFDTVVTWLADGGGYWNTPANWSCGSLPTALDNVLLTGYSNFYVDASANCLNLTVDPWTTVILYGNNAILHVHGSLFNNGKISVGQVSSMVVDGP
jgi:hypothetical protein